MGRKLDVAHLVSSREITDRLDALRPQQVHNWMHTDETFPRPVAVLGAATGRTTLVWYWPEVERWAKRNGRYPMRRRSLNGRAHPAEPSASS